MPYQRLCQKSSAPFKKGLNNCYATVSNLELNTRKKLKDLGVNTIVSLPLAGQKYCPLRLLIRKDTLEGPDTQVCSNVIFKYNLTESRVYIKFLTRDTIAGTLVMDFFLKA